MRNNNFSYVTVSGSVSTGSTPLIDMLREYKGINVVESELRPMKHIIKIIIKLAKKNKIDEVTFNALKNETMSYGDDLPLLLSIYYRVLIRMPVPFIRNFKHHVKYLSYKMLTNRAYEKRIPGYKNATTILFDQLADLNTRLFNIEKNLIKNELAENMVQFLNSISASIKFQRPDALPVFDQMITPYNLFSKPDAIIIAELIPSMGIIIVSRDVRDQYCDIIRKKKKGYYLIDKEKKVDRYIEEYTRRYEDMHRLLVNSPPNVLHIRFEDLIFHYKPTKTKIESFLNIKEHQNPMKYFNPQVAIKNTQLFKNYDNQNEIARIEEEMGQWLYRF